MKRAVAACLALLCLGGCQLVENFRFDNDAVCEDFVDTRERLDCYEQARAETSEARRADRN